MPVTQEASTGHEREVAVSRRMHYPRLLGVNSCLHGDTCLADVWLLVAWKLTVLLGMQA